MTIFATASSFAHGEDEEDNIHILMRRALQAADSPPEASTEQNVVFYIIIAFVFIACGAYNVCFKRRMHAEMIRQQIFQEQTYRQDVIASDSDMENTWECNVCVFRNYNMQKVCMLCGTEQGYKVFGKGREANVGTATEDYVRLEEGDGKSMDLRHIRRSFAKRRLNALNVRQQGARYVHYFHIQFLI